MKLRKYTIAALLAILAYTASLFSYQPQAHGNASQPPAGYVNAPVGNGNCTSCHSGNTLTTNSASISATSTPAGLFTGVGYTPGQLYTITYTLSGGTVYGFEMTCLTAANAAAGTFAVTNATNTALATQTARQYISHKNASSNATWSFSWTAPAATAGTVTFYTCGNLANGNGSDNGDHIHAKTWAVAPIAVTCSLTVSATQTNVTCNGGTNGTATAVPANGTATYTYHWNTTPLQTTATASNLAAGTYAVTVTDAHSCTATTSVTITAPTALSATSSSVNSTCSLSNGSATVTPSGGTGAYTYSWSTSPAQSTATASNIAAGTYTVTVHDANSCSLTKSVTVTNTGTTPALAGTIGGSTTPCTGASSYSVTNVAGVTYTWAVSGGGTITPSGNSASINWNTTGTYTVSVTPSNTCGNGPVSTLSVTVGSRVTSAGAITGNATPCTGTNTYSVTNVAGTTYTWVTSGGTVTPSGNSASIDWTITGTHTISVTPSNTCGNGPVSMLSVTVGTTPSSAGTISGNATPCTGSTSYNVTNVTGTTYTWAVSGGGTVTPSTNSASINWSTTGTYTVSVTPSNSCGNGTASTLTVTVNSIPSAPTISGSASVCPSTAAYSVTQQVGETYAWAISGGGTINPTTGTNVTVTWTAPGNYTVSVTPTNTCGAGTVGTLAVAVSNGGPSAPTISGNTTPCIGNNTYTVPTVNGVTYTWAAAGGTVTPNGNSAVINWTTTGTHSLSVTPSNTCGTGTVGTLSVNVGTVPSSVGTISGNAIPCAGANSYSVTNIVGVTYTWVVSGGGVVTPSGNGASINWAAAGTYTVSVTPSNSCGNGTASTLSVTVSSTPSAPAISGNTNICPSTQVYTVVQEAGVTYAWGILGGGTITPTTGTSVTVTWAGTGTHSVTVTPTNSCGVGADGSLPVIITNGGPSAPVISGNTTPCLGTTTYTVPVVGGVTYVWAISSGGTVTPNGASASINWSTPGTHTISVTPTNSCGAGTVGTLSVAVNASPTVSLGNDTAVCGSSVLSAGNGFSSYLWSTGGTADTIHVVQSSSYSVTVHDANGCTASDIKQVTINNVTPITALQAATTGCDSTVLNAGTYSQYIWSQGGTGQTITAHTDGPYSVTVTDANGCSASASTQVTIGTAPFVSFTSTDNHLTVTYNNTSSGATSVLWSFGDGRTDTASNPVHTYTASGTYVVELQADNSCGAVTFRDTVVVSLTGIAIIADNNIHVYPNPVDRQLTVVLDGENANLELLNQLGEKIYMTKLVEGTPVNIDMSGFASGIYILRLTTDNKVCTHKVVKD